MIVNNIHSAELLSSNQTIKAGVELYNGSTLERVCNCSDTLGSFTVERTGEGKFFGFGICQQLKLELIDLAREINLNKNYSIKVFFTVSGDSIYPFPTFFVDTVERDETSNFLSIVAYDALGAAALHNVSAVEYLQPPFSLAQYAEACASVLGLSIRYNTMEVSDSFHGVTSEAANFDGNETLRDALNDLAEATQTIYYINSQNSLMFRRLMKNAAPPITVGKDQYYTLTSGSNKALGKVVSATELGDNVAAVEPNSVADGVTQYVRDNAFWTLREDIATQVNNAQAAIGGVFIDEFECDWMGNYLLEIGDRIYIIGDNGYIRAYILDDTISFDGALSHYMRWQYNENDNETAANPSTLGDMLNKTIAKVDKVNQTIELRVQSMKDEVAGDIGANTSAITALQLNTNSISSYVTTIEKELQEQIDSNEIVLEAFVQKTFTTEQTAEALKLSVEKIESDGVTKVETSTGFTFDDKGLLVEKDNSENKTLITENGMTVKKVVDSTEEDVLTANSQGVTAVDLKATTYLIIGDHSRFETYIDENNEPRTGCFWLG